MVTIYMKCTIPALPEAVRVSINSVIQSHAGPEATLKAVRRAAARRGVAALYELATREEYLAHRTKLRDGVTLSAATLSAGPL